MGGRLDHRRVSEPFNRVERHATRSVDPRTRLRIDRDRGTPHGAAPPTDISTTSFNLTGTSANGAAGQLVVLQSATVSITGVVASGAVAAGGRSLSLSVFVTSVTASGAVGRLVTSQLTTGVAGSGVSGPVAIHIVEMATIRATGEPKITFGRELRLVAFPGEHRSLPARSETRTAALPAEIRTVTARAEPRTSNRASGVGFFRIGTSSV